MLKFFKIPFALTGDKTAVPDAVDASGYVSYTQGYSFDYQRNAATDAAAKNIERDKMNQILFDVTNSISEIQGQGIPDFITPALNGGTAYSYSKYAIVRYSGSVYVSLVGSNTSLPTDASKWGLLPTPDLFSAQKTINGYQKLSSGIIIQWGQTPVLSTTPVSVTFPIAFPNACLNVSLTNATASNLIVGIVNQTVTKFDGYASGGGNTHLYIAIGY